jgi:sensor histidine kinase YesM
MRIAELILSNKPAHRFLTHLVFWLVYCTYFYTQSLAPRKFEEFRNGDTYYFAWLNLCCFGPVIIFAVYFSIYYLLPKTLAKKKYAVFLFAFLWLYAAGTFVNYFMAGIFLSNVNYSTPIEVNFKHQLKFGNYNTRWAMVIATIAMGIKLTKNWYLQQQENLEMLRKKNRTEMQLQKARLHPEFLLRSLDTIYNHIQTGSEKAPLTILKLSELLSYSLYENGKELVPVERELEQLNNFIALEQQGIAGNLNIQIQASNSTNSNYIVPLIIIKLLEESIALLHKRKELSGLLNMHVSSTNSKMAVTLVYHPVNPQSAARIWLPVVENTKKRLLDFYAKNDFWVELSENEQEVIIRLRLKLIGDRNQPDTVPDIHVKA